MALSLVTPAQFQYTGTLIIAVCHHPSDDKSLSLILTLRYCTCPFLEHTSPSIFSQHQWDEFRYELLRETQIPLHLMFRFSAHHNTRSHIKGQSSRYRLGFALGVPGGLDIRHMKAVRSSASRTGRLYPQECSWYSFSLGAESTPRPWCGRKEICH